MQAAMTEEEIEANALADPDNPPMDADELARLDGIVAVRKACKRTALDVCALADAFGLNSVQLREVALGVHAPTQELLTLLRVIAIEPDAVRRALAA